jgi:hypothetical protein
VSYYGRHISGLWLSTTADYAENELSPAPTETFTATKVIDEPRRHASTSPTNYPLDTWTAIRRVEINNLAESLDAIYFAFTTPDNPAQTSYVTLEPGDSATLSNLYPASTLWGGPPPASLSVNAEALGAYYRLIVLGT